MKNTQDVFNKIQTKMPEQAQYVVNFAYNYPVFYAMQSREAAHMIEIRTIPQGHADYRLVAQEMYALAIKKKHPKLARIIKFADMRTYDLERFESEKRTEVKKRCTIKTQIGFVCIIYMDGDFAKSLKGILDP